MGVDEQLFKEGHWYPSDRRERIRPRVSQNAVEKSLPFWELIPLLWSYTVVTILSHVGSEKQTLPTLSTGPGYVHHLLNKQT
jgi:hypothetical protein